MSEDSVIADVNLPKKHHYLPIFYLKGWCGKDQRLCYFSRPHGELIKALRRHPAAVGYQENLYSFLYLKSEQSQYFERSILAKIDNDAARARVSIMQKNARLISDSQKELFKRFIDSLEIRMPEDIAVMREQWSTEVPVLAGAKKTFHGSEFKGNSEEYSEDFSIELSMYATMQEILKSENSKYHPLKWQKINIPKSLGVRLLTSDRPLMRTYSLSDPQALFMLPLDPWTFLLGRGPTAHPLLRSRRNDKSGKLIRVLADRLNEYVVSNAQRYVFGLDDTQIQYVKKHFATKEMFRLSEIFEQYFGGKSKIPNYKNLGVQPWHFVSVPEGVSIHPLHRRS